MLQGLLFRGRLTKSGIVMCGLVLMISAWGCGARNPWEKVYLAKGVLTYKGKPVPNADIALYPEDASFPDTIRPRAKTTADGEFVVWTNQPGDGAPAGVYKAVVVHQEIVINGSSMGVKPNDLPKKYSNRDSTDLLVQIEEKETEIPLELK